MELLPRFVAAVDKLNGYARNRLCGDELKSHIYGLKNLALRAANDAGVALSEPIYVMAKCLNCQGTGIYSERRGLSCYACEATGKVRLHFRVTRMGPTLACPDWPLSGIVWHTPIGSLEAGLDPRLEGDWKPNQPGSELTPDEVAGALNVAEIEGIATAMLMFGTCLGLPTYSLYLGQWEGVCAFCGGKEDVTHHRVTRDRIWWLAGACVGCEKHWKIVSKRYRSNGLMLDRMPLPQTLFTPNVVEWVLRHGGKSVA